MLISKVPFWLSNLKKNLDFEPTAAKVFDRLIHGKGPGLLVLFGPTKAANKTYFLNTVEGFQEGASAARDFVSSELWHLLSELEPGHYQCINITAYCPVPRGKEVYRTPLVIAVPLALAVAAQERGLSKGRPLVIICHDIHQFMKYNKASNEQFLIELAGVLDHQKGITFLGASRLSWNARAVLGVERVLPLGWD